jgi:iron uptake system component EfeO
MAARRPEPATKPTRTGAIVRLTVPALMAVLLLASTGCQHSAPRPSGGAPAAAQARAPGHTGTPPPSVSASAGARLVPAVRSYRAYLGDQAAALRSRTRSFTDAIRAGNVTAAKQRFASSRTCWERIQSITFLLPELDRRIDGRADDFASPTDPAWTGWHRLEQMLWVGNSTTGARPIADQLDRDLDSVQRAIPTLPITGRIMAAGIERLVEEAIEQKLTGAEDRYSRLDLADLAGNLQGAEAGYVVARPLLTVDQPALTRLLDSRFAAVDRTIAKYRTPAGYRLYPALTPTDRATLQARLSALAELLTGLSADFER